MHLPDGFLDIKTGVISTVAAAAGLGIALRQVRASVEPRRVPLLGLAAAFVFAAQMLNFPVAWGTSGHLLGGVLTAVLLGPSAAVVVMTCVLIVQCLMFNDGGLLVLGANVFNMGIVSVCGGFLVFRLVRMVFPMDADRSTVFAAAFAAWFGTVLGAISCAGQLAFSGRAAWGTVFPAMTNVHMLIGIGEGLATGLIIRAVLRARPELVAGRGEGPRPNSEPRSPNSERGLSLLAYGAVVAMGLGIFVAPFVCPWPDGLETVAQKLGFEARATAPAVPAPLPDYRVPGMGPAATATMAAGLIGTCLAFVAAYGLARFLVPVLNRARKDARN